MTASLYYFHSVVVSNKYIDLGVLNLLDSLRPSVSIDLSPLLDKWSPLDPANCFKKYKCLPLYM
jgi:hypothetical protein